MASSLVTDKLYWAPEHATDVLVKEFCCQGRGIILLWLGLYPLCTVVGGNEDVFVACVACVRVLWDGLIFGTDRTLDSTIGRPVGWSATKALLAIHFVSSHRLRTVRLRFRRVLPVLLFPSHRSGYICAICRRSPSGIACPVSYKNSSFTLLNFLFFSSVRIRGGGKPVLRNSLISVSHLS